MLRQTFYRETIETPTGTMLIVTCQDGDLRALDWEDYEARMRTLLQRQYPADSFALRDGANAPVSMRDALESYFAGELEAIAALSTRTGGTAFQRLVWQQLRTIPSAQTRSYGALAAELGKPSAARAVGLANGANPIAIVVPCHRVIGASSALTGYGGGLPRKRWLLDHEARFRSSRGAQIELVSTHSASGV